MTLRCEVCGGHMQMMGRNIARCFGGGIESCGRVVTVKSYEDRIDPDSTIDMHDNSDGSMRYGLNKNMRDE